VDLNHEIHHSLQGIDVIKFSLEIAETPHSIEQQSQAKNITPT